LGRLAAGHALATAHAAAQMPTLLAQLQSHDCSGSPGSPTLSVAVHDSNFCPGLIESLAKTGSPDHAALICLSPLTRHKQGHKPNSATSQQSTLCDCCICADVAFAFDGAGGEEGSGPAAKQAGA